MTGVFIAFEGGDGAGKSTQANLLEAALSQRGYASVLLREPGSTELGEHLRGYLVAGRERSAEAELLLFEAARHELMSEKIRPQLDAGAVVIADRFAGSTVAYQGYGRGLDLQHIQWLNDFATGGQYPDLTLLLDVPPPIGLERAKNRRVQLTLPLVGDSDGFEDEDLAFHQRVRQGFQRQADDSPERWRVIDGGLSIEEVAAKVMTAVDPLLDQQVSLFKGA